MLYLHMYYTMYHCVVYIVYIVYHHVSCIANHREEYTEYHCVVQIVIHHVVYTVNHHVDTVIFRVVCLEITP
jgi:hypothetical protein